MLSLRPTEGMSSLSPGLPTLPRSPATPTSCLLQSGDTQTSTLLSLSDMPPLEPTIPRAMPLLEFTSRTAMLPVGDTLPTLSVLSTSPRDLLRPNLRLRLSHSTTVTPTTATQSLLPTITCRWSTASPGTTTRSSLATSTPPCPATRPTLSLRPCTEDTRPDTTSR